MRYNSSLNETLKKAAVVLTVNKETDDLLKTSKYYQKGSNFNVADAALPIQFEENKYVQKKINKELRILWVGRLLPRRGLELSFKALSYLPANMPYKLIIVGDGEQGKKIKKWIKKYNLSTTKIEHLGWIPYKQMHQEYEKADIMLFCPLRDTAGLQATEAMGFGLPIITLNISGMQTIIPENCGIKIHPSSTNGTAKDIANAIEKMYINSDFRRTAGQNAYKEAIQNTWANKIDAVTSQFY